MRQSNSVVPGWCHYARPVLEEVGYSLFGPLAVNIAAPDEGNVHLHDLIADRGQREDTAASRREPAPPWR